nr:type II and III secretion system protein family protein [Sphingomonas jejuensis]
MTPGDAFAQQRMQAPETVLSLSKGGSRLMTLDAPITDVFVANPAVADVQVRSPTQIYVFGKDAGETTVSATSRNGTVVYSSTVRVGQNVETIDQMLSLAMPEAELRATPMNGLVLLTGTVANPEDAAEAERLVTAFVGANTQVISRLRTATPQQVNLQVRIAEVSRDISRQIGVNLLSRDSTGGFLFGIAQGNAGTITGQPGGGVSYEFPQSSAVGTTLAGAGNLFGLNVLATLDLAENNGSVTTLANPNLTALSGETASFLAGGEIPIPLSSGLGNVSVEYKQYGVSLSFTPIVMSDGRISIRVRPEVSELTSVGSVTLNDFEIPGITTRRAETTVELGSGQSFVIGGLLSNRHNNTFNKAPGLGDIPIIGALFRSNRFQRAETELMIVVTPYLVRPVSANQIALPTDGYRGPTDAQRLILGSERDGRTEGRPVPQTGAPVQVAPDGASMPAIGAASSPAIATQASAAAAPAPGFSF